MREGPEKLPATVDKDVIERTAKESYLNIMDSLGYLIIIMK